MDKVKRFFDKFNEFDNFNELMEGNLYYSDEVSKYVEDLIQRILNYLEISEEYEKKLFIEKIKEKCKQNLDEY